jgi:transcriptional regulator with XRE-family HTH domain
MMTNDSRGYSYSLVKELQAGDPKQIGVQLGLYAIEHNVSVGQLAKEFGVSRHSIYNWFRGKFQPRPDQLAKIQAYIGLAPTDDTAV